jgi:hypothetical protein
MRSATRRLAAATAAALLIAGVAVPANAGAGPAIIDDHDSFVAPRAYELSSSTGGTVYGTDDGGFGHVFLAPAPMTTGSARIDLGPRPRTRLDTTIRGSRVAMPVAGATPDTPVTQARSCVIGTCPTMSTLTTPAGWRYIGNADDRAILWHAATNTVGLIAWTGGAVTNTYLMPVAYSETPAAYGDAGGIAISGGGEVSFVDRTDGSIHYLDYGDGAVLTPTYVVWYAVAVGEPSFDQTRIYRVLRNTSSPNPTPEVQRSLAGAPAVEMLAANDTGVAWTVPNEDSEGTGALWTMPWDGTPALYARPLTTNGLTAFEGGSQFLVNDRRAGIPGLYKITPGAYSGALTGLVPTRGAITYSLAVSNGRAAYVDDTTEDLPLFMRTVTDGLPGPESLVTDTTAGSVGLSGPYIAYTRPTAIDNQLQVVYGRTDGTMSSRTFPIYEIGRVVVSGRRALLTGGARARVIDIPTGTVTDLGTVFAAIFGEYVAMINYNTGAVTRRNLDNGATQTVRAAVAGCASSCVDDDNWQLAMWGHEVVYAFGHGGTSPGVAAGLWNGNTGVTSETPMLTSGGEPTYTEIAYWSGLLLVARNNATVHLYDMRNGAADAVVDSFAEEPFALDGNVVAWRPLSHLKAVVRDVRDFVPGHAPELRYLGGAVPGGFGPGTANPEWKPSFLVSQEMTGTLQIRTGSASGTIVRTIPVGTLNGELAAAWDGTDNAEADLPQGTYYWTIEKNGIVPESVKRASGTSAVSGSVYLSRTPLGAPSLTTPVLSTDVSATGTFPLSWTVPAGAPAGTRFVVQRSVNGGAWATTTNTAATSMSYGGAPGTTYRFRVAAVDPAGRTGSMSAEKATIVPFNDNAAGTVYTGTWGTGVSSSLFGGSHRYSGVANSTYTFKATGSVIYLVGSRGTTYGQFQVSIDGGAYSSVIDSYATTSQVRKVLYARGRLSNTAHTIRVRVVGTSGRPNVSVDAVGFLR